MNVAVIKTRQNRLAAGIDDLGVRADQGTELVVGSDSHDAFAADRDSLGDARSGINSDHLRVSNDLVSRLNRLPVYRPRQREDRHDDCRGTRRQGGAMTARTHRLTSSSVLSRTRIQ